MKAFGKTVGKTVVFCLVMMLMCSFVYPLALTGVSQLTMKAKADGSKVDKDGNLTTDTKEAVGSALIGFYRGLLFSGKSFRCKLQYLYRRAERKRRICRCCFRFL
jgi:K+-transporting ATPase c subunit